MERTALRNRRAIPYSGSHASQLSPPPSHTTRLYCLWLSTIQRWPASGCMDPRSLLSMRLSDLMIGACPRARAILLRRGPASQVSCMPETSLYPVVKRFLEEAGFTVKGEIHGCDAVAVRDEGPTRLAIVEMKLGFNLELLLQAMDRMRVADEVWLAVPATRRGRDRDPRVHRLCRAVGFGLMAVNLRSNRVEVLAQLGLYRPRRDTRRRISLLSEHARRNGDPSAGGSSRQPIMTAYRQRALACAASLHGKAGRPRDLRDIAPDAARILRRNVYGWFEHTERGVYRLTALGEAALLRWPCVAQASEDELSERSRETKTAADHTGPMPCRMKCPGKMGQYQRDGRA